MFEAIVDPVIDPREEQAREAEAANSAVEADPDVDDPEVEAVAVAGDGAAVDVAEPAAVDARADTGRLFRSQGVSGHDDAVLALSSAHFGRLRTLRRSDTPEPVGAPESPESIVIDDAGPVLPAADAAPEEVAVTRRARRRSAADTHRSRQITGGAVYLIVIGVTLAVAFVNAWLSDGDIGWPTGLALAVATVYCALTVRRVDDVVAVIAPPIAFLVAALTAGQLFLGAADASILNRAVVVFFTLADNWVWIIGSTLAALVIVLVRRRRG